MNVIIGSSGFGVIELLIVAVLIMVLASTLLRVHLRSDRQAPVAMLESQLREDLEKSGPVTFYDIQPTVLEAANRRGRFRYELTGTVPARTVVRVAGEQVLPLAERAASVRFTAYDENRRFLPDRPAPEQFRSIRRLRVEVYVHDEKEDPGFYLNDGLQGMDLDGDPGNGVAHVRERDFGLTLEASP